MSVRDKADRVRTASRVLRRILTRFLSLFAPSPEPPRSGLWAQRNCSYPVRDGNKVDIFIDGQAAYAEISSAFKNAGQFIYMTISYGAPDFLMTPATGGKMFDLLGSCCSRGVDVRMVIWQPAEKTDDTIPDPGPAGIPGVNEGPNSIHARWDRAKGYSGWYSSPHNRFLPVYRWYPSWLGCHHQKTYVMDDGTGGAVAYVGGINPVQAYWDTTHHDSLDARRLPPETPPLDGLEHTPPLHDVFYRITGPAVADVFANFVERYNGASIAYADQKPKPLALLTAEETKPAPDGIRIQILRTIAPKTYKTTRRGDRGIREVYLNALCGAGAESLVYIENQYFFDNGIISEIHEAVERGAKIIVVLTANPDWNSLQGKVELMLETIEGYTESSLAARAHANIGLFTLGNAREDPRQKGKFIFSDTYVHSKNMAVFGPNGAVMTGGSANIAFTSMWFHSEVNIALTQDALIRQWVARLWSEHLSIQPDRAAQLIDSPDRALEFFRTQAGNNAIALAQRINPEGRVYNWGTDFPLRELEGIDLSTVVIDPGNTA